jgi:hypothetical protein
MTQRRTTMLSVAVAALALGVAGQTPQMATSDPLFAGDITLAADDTPTATDDTPAAAGSQGASAKMGKGEGTHTGPDQGVTPESDTSKIVQPPRRNPTTGGETPTGQ